MMKMDISGSDHSPPFSENNGSWSWAQWEHEISSLSGLNAGSSTELYGLVEDKEIAARAVAFVVNSTRKGIVPLCADVANLLRSKRSLERKVYILKRENEAFRSSASVSMRTSQSTSPIPQSLSSYTDHCIKGLQDQSFNSQDRHRPCSRCSQCSSTLSYSPKLEKPGGGLGRQNGRHQWPGGGLDSQRHGSVPTLSLESAGIQNNSAAAFKNPESVTVEVEAVLLEHQEDESGGNKVDQDSAVTHGNVTISTDCDTYRPGSVAHENDSSEQQKERYEKQSGFSKQDSGSTCLVVTMAEIHGTFDNGASVPSIPCPVEGADIGQENKMADQDGKEPSAVLPALCGEQTAKHSLARRNSLPEIVCVPNREAQRVCLKVSKAIQCSLNWGTSLNPGSELDEGSGLNTINSPELKDEVADDQVEEDGCSSRDLMEARKEIENLKQRLQELESNATGRPPSDQVFYENEDGKSLEDNGYFTGGNRSTRSSKPVNSGHCSYSKRGSPKRFATTPVSYVGPLPACKCAACLEAMGSDDDLSHYSDQLADDPPRYAVNSKLQVQLDDHVLVKGAGTGYIRYIGHVDRNHQPNMLFIGLELDNSGGHHDGCLNGKHYFYCGKDKGVFVPLQDVICKVNKKTVKSPRVSDLVPISASRPRKHHKKPQPPPEEDDKMVSY